MQWSYFIRRVLWSIPTLLIISLLAFGLSKVAPGDAAEQLLSSLQDVNRGPDPDRFKREYARLSTELGLRQPTFYFSVKPAFYPDTLYRLDPTTRSQALGLLQWSTDWNGIQHYLSTLSQWENLLIQGKGTVAVHTNIQLRKIFQARHGDTSFDSQNSFIAQSVEVLHRDSAKAEHYEELLQMLTNGLNAIHQKNVKISDFIPVYHWHGVRNQYHFWLSGLLGGNFGVSIIDGRSVTGKVWNALGYTLGINISAIFFIYIISIPLGLYIGSKQNSVKDKMLTYGTFLLYAIPSFWLATMLVMFFTTPEYGMWIFPSIGPGQVFKDTPFLEKLMTRVSHLFLPILCVSYTGLAFLVRQMRRSTISTLREGYIQTGKAKGLSSRTILRKHVLKNASFPMITLFANVFPAAITGSIAIEMIFNIPGMGKLVLDSIYEKDWGVLYTVVTLTSVLTILGSLVSDIMFSYLDPRVRFSNASNE